MKKRLGYTLVAVALVLVLIIVVAGCRKQQAEDFSPQALAGRDVTTFKGAVRIAVPTDIATATPGLVVDCEGGTSNCMEVRVNATPVTVFNSSGTMGGALDLNGQVLDLDADNDTSITASTDDQVDFEIGGADIMVMNEWGASNITTAKTEHLFEILDSSPIISTATGTTTLTGLNIDLGIGNSVAGTNIINGILIDAISQDAQNTETAIVIANGWDRGIDLDGNSLYVDNDQDSILSEASDDVIIFTPGAATGSFEIRSGNLQVGDGTPDETHNGEDFYVEGISEFDGTAYFDGAVDFDGVANFVMDTEHIGIPSVITTTVTYTTANQVIATIGDGEIWFVWAVFVNVTTNYDCTGNDCTMIVGDGADTDGFCLLADAELQTTDAEQTGSPAGWQCLVAATMGVYLDGAVSSAPHIYAPSGAAETIDLDVGGTDPAAGAATVYVIYTRYH